MYTVTLITFVGLFIVLTLHKLDGGSDSIMDNILIILGGSAIGLACGLVFTLCTTICFDEPNVKVDYKTEKLQPVMGDYYLIKDSDDDYVFKMDGEKEYWNDVDVIYSDKYEVVMSCYKYKEEWKNKWLFKINEDACRLYVPKNKIDI